MSVSEPQGIVADAIQGLINYRSLLPALLYKSNDNTVRLNRPETDYTYAHVCTKDASEV